MPYDAGGQRTRLVIASDPMAVRRALQTVAARLAAKRISVDACENAQIVLTEALNNIVEHAYAESAGEIEVTIDLTETGLTCRIVDAGLPLPGGVMPQATAAIVARGEDLREGGYGWHLIRSLALDLSYRRAGGRNFLTFRIASPQGPA